MLRAVPSSAWLGLERPSTCDDRLSGVHRLFDDVPPPISLSNDERRHQVASILGIAPNLRLVRLIGDDLSDGLLDICAPANESLDLPDFINCPLRGIRTDKRHCWKGYAPLPHSTASSESERNEK